jgi:hypothetical protein
MTGGRTQVQFFPTPAPKLVVRGAKFDYKMQSAIKVDIINVVQLISLVLGTAGNTQEFYPQAGPLKGISEEPQLCQVIR